MTDDEDWLPRFRTWLAEAEAAGLPEPNAMVLATATRDGQPSARTVLLKEVDERGFAFFTNLRSRKGREAAANPWASVVFPWLALGRQVVAEGHVEPLSDEESDAYFATRSRDRQLGAHASAQGQPLASRAALDEAYAAAAERFPGEVPRPEYWGGLRVVPDAVEFWIGHPSRLHDRFRYRREMRAWVVERLSP